MGTDGTNEETSDEAGRFHLPVPLDYSMTYTQKHTYNHNMNNDGQTKTTAQQ